MNEFVKKYILEIFLILLIAVTVLVRTLRNPKRYALDAQRPTWLQCLDVLGSVCIGCSVGIAIFIGAMYFTGSENSYLGFLAGYLLGSLGEKILNVLDLKFGDFLTEFIQALINKLGGK